eukprot:CAMPEP_0181496662 /NCGR_PEP_ID=MMETSP1110-20121109/53109_1 /TAXON_ID=174948 /ORGANISM="Symbiodinium sp., Strain CCMP421" /LENGTH=133 /DNA_ID=CAMNT_0023624525 /DNA_START=25 /DNA_END=423 /DNA_ORIENTATION=-
MSPCGLERSEGGLPDQLIGSSKRRQPRRRTTASAYSWHPIAPASSPTFQKRADAHHALHLQPGVTLVNANAIEENGGLGRPGQQREQKEAAAEAEAPHAARGVVPQASWRLRLAHRQNMEDAQQAARQGPNTA